MRAVTDPATGKQVIISDPDGPTHRDRIAAHGVGARDQVLVLLDILDVLTEMRDLIKGSNQDRGKRG